jgi:hypothetical protein
MAPTTTAFRFRFDSIFGSPVEKSREESQRKTGVDSGVRLRACAGLGTPDEEGNDAQCALAKVMKKKAPEARKATPRTARDAPAVL